MVVALMQGHLGNPGEGEVLPQWDPKRANLAVDVGKILSSDPDLMTLITRDIDRYYNTDPAETSPANAGQTPPADKRPVAQQGDVSGIAPAAPPDHIQSVESSQESSEP